MFSYMSNLQTYYHFKLIILTIFVDHIMQFLLITSCNGFLQNCFPTVKFTSNSKNQVSDGINNRTRRDYVYVKWE